MCHCRGRRHIAFREISRPIDYIRGKLKLVEDGDLTVRSNYTGKYEIGQLSQSFNNMTINMKRAFKQVGSVADKVYHNANELKEIAKKSAQASKEVMQAVESVTMERPNRPKTRKGIGYNQDLYPSSTRQKSIFPTLLMLPARPGRPVATQNNH